MGEVNQLALTALHTILNLVLLSQGILEDALGAQGEGEAGKGADREQ